MINGLKTLLFAFSLMVMTTHVGFAAKTDLPTVNWSADVLAMDDNNPLLDFPGVREKIAKAITNKLHALQREGKLPFKLKEVTTDYGNHVIATDEPIGIIPLSTLDTSFDSSVRAGSKLYYNSIVFSGLSFAIVSADSLNESWRILGTIPLSSAKLVGNNVYDLRDTPITIQEKADVFTKITIDMINNQLEFNDKKMFKDIEMKSFWPDTYQVTEVKITSPKAQEIFAGREREVQEIIGAFFTSKYQSKTRRIVYPPRGGGNWKQDVNKNLYTFQTNTPSGEITFSIENPRNPITLDFFGVAVKEMDTGKESKVVRDIFYKVWLRKSPVEKNDQPEYTHHGSRRQIKTGNAWIDYDPADVLIQLLIDASEKMGAQKK